jgi:predicted nucleotidyltransferase
MHAESLDLFAILECLSRHDVDFIIVGGVSAVLNGAPVTTFDLDIVHSREPDNLDRLVEALTELDARYRYQTRDLVPQRSHLESEGHQLLMTRAGPLDVLGSIDEGSSYRDLLSSSHTVEIEGRTYRVLDLDALIDIKIRAGRDKDRVMLGVLRQTRALEEE